MRRVGCAAVAFSGLAGTVYAITSGMRRGDFSRALWAVDPLASPPLSTQRQLREEGHESDEEEAPRRVCNDRESLEETRDALHSGLQRAMRNQDIGEVQRLSRELEQTEDENTNSVISRHPEGKTSVMYEHDESGFL